MRIISWRSLVAGLLVAGGTACTPHVLTTPYQPYTINIYGPPSVNGQGVDPFMKTSQFKITLSYFEDDAGQIPYGSSLSKLPSGFEHFSPTVVVTYPGSSTSFPLTQDGKQAALPRLNANQQNFFVKAEILGLDASGAPVARARCPLQQVSADPVGTMGTVTCQAFYGLIGQWSLTRPMHFPRADFAAVALPDGRIVVAGGRIPGVALDSGRFRPLTSIEIYDPFARDMSDSAAPPGTWTRIGDLSEGRFGLTGTFTPDGHVIFAGGMTVQNPRGSSTCTGETCLLLPSKAVDVLDPGNMSITTKAFANGENRAQHAAALLNGTTVLVAGGVEGLLDPTGASSMFKPAVDFQELTPTAQTSLGNMDVERHFPCLVSPASNEMVLCSGEWASGGPTGMESCEVLDSSGAVQHTVMGSVARSETRCDAVNGTVFIVGGELASSQAQIESLTGGNIQPFAPAPYKVVGHGVAASNGQVVVVGGHDPNVTDDPMNWMTKTYWINPSSPMQMPTVPDSATLHFARSGLQLLGLPDGTVMAIGGAGPMGDPGAEILAVPDLAQ